MKTMILSACACFAVALLCFGFLRWNSGTITSDPVQVVKLTTPCQYLQRPTGQLLPGVEQTFHSMNTGRLYPPTGCTPNSLHLNVGDDVVISYPTVPGYSSPPSGILTLIGSLAVFALALGLGLMVRLLRAARKTNGMKG